MNSIKINPDNTTNSIANSSGADLESRLLSDAKRLDVSVTNRPSAAGHYLGVSFNLVAQAYHTAKDSYLENVQGKMPRALLLTYALAAALLTAAPDC